MLPTRQQWREALAARHGEALQKTLEQTTVAICGLGGLGSNIALCLARAGVGRLLLLDFDRVDLTNLHRQQYKASQIGLEKSAALAENLREVNPYVELVPRTIRLTEENVPGLLSGAQVICEAFDRAEAKAMLVNTVLEQLPEAYLVAASGMAGLGSANQIKTRKITSHFYLCGDGVSDVEGAMGLVASRVMACAAQEAHMVLRLLAGYPEP